MAAEGERRQLTLTTMRSPKDARQRALAYHVDRRARELIALGQPWQAGMLDFPYDDLSDDDKDFIARRVSEWKSGNGQYWTE